MPEVSDKWKLVCLEFLVFWGREIIKSPLFEWDVSAYKHDQLTVLLAKVFNKMMRIMYNVYEK